MKKYITLNSATIIVGIIAGYFYWYFYACTDGCALTGNWYSSMALGGAMGYSIGGLLKDVQSNG